MELTPYVEALRRDLAAAAAPGGEDVLRAADMLSGSVEASVRLVLLEALSDAAAEITARLSGAPAASGGVTVEVRLRGREAQFVVSEAGPAPTMVPAGGPSPAEGESGDLARLTLRMPESLKEAVERLAAAEAISVNAWLVRAITRMASGVQQPPGSDVTPPGRGRLGRRVTGFAQA
jgi:HicB family